MNTCWAQATLFCMMDELLLSELAFLGNEPELVQVDSQISTVIGSSSYGSADLLLEGLAALQVRTSFSIISNFSFIKHTLLLVPGT